MVWGGLVPVLAGVMHIHQDEDKHKAPISAASSSPCPYYLSPGQGGTNESGASH